MSPATLTCRIVSGGVGPKSSAAVGATGEVGLGIDSQAILLALVGLDAVGHSCLLCSPSQHAGRLLLKIRTGNRLAAVLDNLGHSNRERRHSTTHVHEGHSRLDAGCDDLSGLWRGAAQRNVRRGWAPEVDPVIVQSVLRGCDVRKQKSRSVMIDRDKTKEQLIAAERIATVPWQSRQGTSSSSWTGRERSSTPIGGLAVHRHPCGRHRGQAASGLVSARNGPAPRSKRSDRSLPPAKSSSTTICSISARRRSGCEFTSFPCGMKRGK